MGKTFVNRENTEHRPTGKYTKVIDKIAQDGICPFCPEHLTQIHPKPILKEGRYWLFTTNAYPYEGATHHFMFIHREHVEHFQELTPEAWLELQQMLNDALATYNIKGGTFVFRFGETKYTGASVAHLHAQLVSGSGEKSAKPVLMRIG